MPVITILASSSYTLFNKDIAKLTSINTAVMLSAMCSKYDYNCKSRTTVVIDGEEYFYFRREDIEEETTLNEKAQLKCCNQLAELGIIKIKKYGLPAKNYYTIDEAVLVRLLENQRKIQFSQNGGTGAPKLEEQESQNREDILLINNNNTDTNKQKDYNKSKDLPNKREFKKYYSSNFGNLIGPVVKNVKVSEEAERIYGAYPRKKGKAAGIELVVKYLTEGVFSRGYKIRFTHEELYCAVRAYAIECKNEEVSANYIKYFNTFMKEAVADYVDTAKESGYEEYMRRNYGDSWQNVTFVYEV